MSQDDTPTRAPAGTFKMASFERNLTWWVLCCSVAGVALGHAFPPLFHRVADWKVAEVNLPVAVLIWLMIVPMLLKVDFGALHEFRRHVRGIGVTLFINFTLSQVALNDVIMLFAFAPLVGLPLGCPPSRCHGTRWRCRSCSTSSCRWTARKPGGPNDYPTCSRRNASVRSRAAAADGAWWEARASQLNP